MKRVWTALITLCGTGMLFADGGVFPPSGVNIYEPYQNAIIEHHGSNEVLHLVIGVENYSESFGWIVPLPSKPEIKKDTIELFSQFEEMCRPSYEGFGCWGGAVEGGDYRNGVDIIDEGSVGDWSYETIRADNPDTLFNWLATNGYSVTDSLRAVEIFADYISRDWIFVAFKVDSAVGQNVNVQPVSFSFTSSEIVYPMKITSLSASSVEVIFHVIAEHRVDVSEGADYYYTEYANKLNAREYEAVKKNYPMVAGISNDDDFITRIYASLYDSSEFADLVFTFAKTDDETIRGENNYREIGLRTFPLLPVAFVSLGGFGIARRFIRRRNR